MLRGFAELAEDLVYFCQAGLSQGDATGRPFRNEADALLEKISDSLKGEPIHVASVALGMVMSGLLEYMDASINAKN